LVELLMAAVTAAMLFAAFSALLRGGWVVWARTTDGLEELNRRRAFLECVAQDLTNAVAFPTVDGAQPSVRLEAQPLQLYTVQPARMEGQPARLWWVEYAVEETPAGRAVVRRARLFHPGGGDATQQRFTGIEGMAFRYGPRDVEVTVRSSGQQPVRHRLHLPAGGTAHEA